MEPRMLLARMQFFSVKGWGNYMQNQANDLADIVDIGWS